MSEGIESLVRELESHCYSRALATLSVDEDHCTIELTRKGGRVEWGRKPEAREFFISQLKSAVGGTLILRSYLDAEEQEKELRGYHLYEFGSYQGISEAKLFDICNTDEWGEPISPELGVRYIGTAEEELEERYPDHDLKDLIPQIQGEYEELKELLEELESESLKETVKSCLELVAARYFNPELQEIEPWGVDLVSDEAADPGSVLAMEKTIATWGEMAADRLDQLFKAKVLKVEIEGPPEPPWEEPEEFYAFARVCDSPYPLIYLDLEEEGEPILQIHDEELGMVQGVHGALCEWSEEGLTITPFVSIIYLDDEDASFFYHPLSRIIYGKTEVEDWVKQAGDVYLDCITGDQYATFPEDPDLLLVEHSQISLEVSYQILCLLWEFSRQGFDIE